MIMEPWKPFSVHVVLLRNGTQTGVDDFHGSPTPSMADFGALRGGDDGVTPACVQRVLVDERADHAVVYEPEDVERDLE